MTGAGIAIRIDEYIKFNCVQFLLDMRVIDDVNLLVFLFTKDADLGVSEVVDCCVSWMQQGWPD